MLNKVPGPVVVQLGHKRVTTGVPVSRILKDGEVDVPSLDTQCCPEGMAAMKEDTVLADTHNTL